MSGNVQSLWPQQIRQRTQSPRRILRAQAAALTTQTGGMLLAEIKYKETEEQIITLDFDVVVPALGGYRHRLFRVGYRKDYPYPVMVDAEVFGANGRIYFSRFLDSGGDINPAAKNSADGDAQLVELLYKVLHSSEVISAVQSLLARASDALEDTEPPGTAIAEVDPATSVDEPEQSAME